MKDVVGQIYNGFLLRDLLGYVVPGSFVFGCVTHMYVTLIEPISWRTLYLAPQPGIVAWLFIISLCYGCGHFLTGIFFHNAIFRPVFTYVTKEQMDDYPEMSRDDAWSAHRSGYIDASKVLGALYQGHVERHAAILHFTGNFSAGLLFTILYVIGVSIYERQLELVLFALPLALVFPGIYLHYRRLARERYRLERSAIQLATERLRPASTPPAPPPPERPAVGTIG